MRVLLLSMPWAPAHRPSIQLATLTAYLRREAPDITTAVRHPSLRVAQQLGFAHYQALCEKSWAGEALYCGLLFPARQEQALAVARKQLGRRWSGPSVEKLQLLLASELDRLAEDPLTASSDLIGLSVCFSQLASSLAAACLIKRNHPASRIVLGGSSCTPASCQALLRLMPQIDHVICGEGEIPLLRLCQFLQGRLPSAGPGVFQRDSVMDAFPAREQQIPRLDRLPLPDFSDYFAEKSALGLSFFPELPVEFSRGCWWNRCAFCNLNLQWHGYRHKSAARMWQEVTELKTRFSCLDFSFTDNALPPADANDFFARTAQSGLDFRFFGEIRATVSATTLRQWTRGGLHTVQIGVEALSDSLLRRMGKGVSVMDNIAVMKQALAAGVAADGNLILEFPSSTDDEVAETLALLDYVLPFRPLAAATFFLGQESPIWQHPQQFGLRGRTIHPLFRRLFPETWQQNFPFLIAAGRGDRQAQRLRWRPVRDKIARWQRFHRQRRQGIPALSYRDGGDFLLIRQERLEGPPLRHRLTSEFRCLYLACDSPRAIDDLLRTFSALAPETIRAFLRGMAAKKLLYSDNSLALALAVPENKGQRHAACQT